MTPAAKGAWQQLLSRLVQTPLRRDATGALLLHAAGMLGTLVAGIVLARTLGPSEYGRWVTIMAVVAILATIAPLGLTNLVLRRVAAHRERGEHAAARDVLSFALLRVAAASVLLAAASMLLGATAGLIRPGEAGIVAVALCAVPPMAIGGVLAATLRAQGHAMLANSLTSVPRPVMLAFGVIGLAFVAPSVGTFEAIAVNTLVALIVGAACTVAVLRYATGLLRISLVPAPPGVWRESLPFLVVGATAMIGARIDVLIIARLCDSNSVGLYEVAARVAELILLPLIAATTVIGPEFARRNAAADVPGLQRLAVTSCRGLVLLALPVSIVLLAAGDVVLTALFGAGFAPAGSALSILTVGNLLVLAMGPVHVLLGMAGHSMASAVGSIVAAGAGAGLSLLLVPQYGIEGAAMARTTSQAVVAAVLALYVLRTMGVAPTVFGRAWTPG